MSYLKLDQWFGDTDPRALPQLLAVLRRADFRPADTGISSRKLQRWETENLIVSSREKAGNWRAFTYPEFVWLMMVKKMRDLGVPYSLIKSVKNQLFGAVSSEKKGQERPESPFFGSSETEERPSEDARRGTHGEPYRVEGPFPCPMLMEGLIARCVRFRGFSYLRIFPDGSLFPTCSGEGDFAFPEPDPERLSHGGFFTVPLSAIVADYLLETGAVFEPDTKTRLSETDATIFDIIQSGDYEKVTIRFRESKPVSLDLVQVHRADTSIGEVLAGADEQDMSVTKSGGVVTRIEQRVSVNLDQAQEQNPLARD